ncbi:MAG TPA: hypothetical protein VNV17_08375 [Solirubrobacteraceae bacterium]|jgi:hypothetical protein|nr:hypothetical protein [Solirubrobacteraceae bacterium]
MKRISTILVVVVALALGATTYAAVLHSNAAALKAPSRRAIVVSAQVSGLLYPGSVRSVRLRIKNLLAHKVRVLGLQLKPGRPTGRCPTWAVIGGRIAVRMTIARRGTRTAYASLRMLTTAPDSCQGTSVPLAFSATLDGQP